MSEPAVESRPGYPRLDNPAGNLEGNFVSIEEKIERYRAFWNNKPVERPIVGFSLGGFFPLNSYSAMQKLRDRGELLPDMLRPEDYLGDYDRIIAQWGEVEDDIIRAVAPIPPFPWLEAMFGCPVHIGEESIWAEEGSFDYADLGRIDTSPENPWRRKYLEFVAALVDRYGLLCPVGQPILRGVSDQIAALRGSSQMVFDLYDRPEEYALLAGICTDLLIGVVDGQLRIEKLFGGGYEVEQLSLWAPDRIIRLQEDASALLSPELYVKHLRGYDRRITDSFAYSVIHLHSSSLFLVDNLLEIDTLRCIQINKDVGGSSVEEMLPYFKKVQAKGRPLLVRGKLDYKDLALLRENLSPRGLYLQIVVESTAEARAMGEFFRPW